MAVTTGDDPHDVDPERHPTPGLSPQEARVDELDRSPESRSMARSVPLLATMMALTVLSEVVVIFAGMNGVLQYEYVAWYAGVPLLTVIAVAVGGVAANAGWQRDRQNTAGRPLFYGMIAGITTSIAGFAILAWISRVSHT